jgi:hypothetical protein
MRLYFSKKIDSLNFTIPTKYSSLKVDNLTRIYSTEGLFQLLNNTFSKVIIRDYPIETVTINNIDFLIDKSQIVYDYEWKQLEPNHIVEHIKLYTYDLSVLQETAGIQETTSIQLVIEKKKEEISELYFVITNYINEKNIVTLISELNLC